MNKLRNRKTKRNIKRKRVIRGGTRRMLPTPGGEPMYEDEMPVTDIDTLTNVKAKVGNLAHKVNNLMDDEKEIRQQFLLMSEEHEEIRDEINKMKTEGSNEDLKREIEELKKQLAEDREKIKQLIMDLVFAIDGAKNERGSKHIMFPIDFAARGNLKKIGINGYGKRLIDKYDLKGQILNDTSMAQKYIVTDNFVEKI